MTDKELRKLKRADLLEILFHLQKELDEAREENETMRQQLHGGLGVKLTDESMEQLIRGVAEALRSPGGGNSAQGGKQQPSNKRRR